MPEQKPRAIRLVEDPWATLRHLVEVLALIAAGAWAFYTFIYQEKIKPASEPAILDDTITVQRVGHDRTRDILEVSIHLHNGGKTEIEVAANGYNVWGDRYALSSSRSTRSGPHDYAFDNNERRISRQLIGSFAELRDAAVGGKRGRHSTIEPDGVVTIPYIIVIPRGKYDVIHAEVTAIPAKTPVRPRVNVQIIRYADGSITLNSLTPGVYEDSNSVDFGLLPD
ncbi:MAG TPA: hypothetical protein VMB20_07935 [Candidatus Acidoferrum sp.]|nr:hypothetical protein [Candidatus Acidoferrum sp.]